MTTPHEAVTGAIAFQRGHHDAWATKEEMLEDPDREDFWALSDVALATSAIEALREGAVDRANSVVSWSPATELIINAILGPPNEVPE